MTIEEWKINWSRKMGNGESIDHREDGESRKVDVVEEQRKLRSSNGFWINYLFTKNAWSTPRRQSDGSLVQRPSMALALAKR